MTDATLPGTDATIDRQGKDVPKTRHCLKCKTTFKSSWCGERICSRCKSSKTWIDGVSRSSKHLGQRR